METSVPTATTDLLASLHAVLDAMGPVAVAVSGGVDSTTLAALALARKPSETRLFHAVSPAVPAAATERLRAVAEPAGWPLSIIDAGEFSDPNYLRNPVNRCFYCKHNLYRTIRQHTTSTVLSGANLDDLDDFRPGLRAAKDHAVRHPWIEARIDKAAIRRLAAAHGLEQFAGLPASPCLSSRVETGISIADDVLDAIDTAEQMLRRELTPATVRCRVRADAVTVELDGPTLELLDEDERRDLGERVRALFAGTDRRGTVGFEPYRRGSAVIRRQPGE